MISERVDQRLHDEKYDELRNCWITLTYIDGDLASTFRVHVANVCADSTLPSLAVFPDCVERDLKAGRVVVDPTRLAARVDAAVRHPELPFAALRPAWLACEYFGADLVLATVAAEHEAFYRKTFGYETLSEPRDYPQLTFKVVCLGLDYKSAKADVERRYPFFRSSLAEREALFAVPPVLSRAPFAKPSPMPGLTPAG